MRKATIVCVAAIFVAALTSLPLFADTVTFSGSTNGTLTTSGSSIPVDMWSTTSNSGFPTETLNFNISGGTVSISNIFSTTFVSGDLTSNNCNGSTTPCEVDILGGASFAMNSTFFTNLGISGPNLFTLSGLIQGQNLSGGVYTVSSWGLDAVQSQVPEPGSILLLGSGLLLVAPSIRRKLNS